MSLRLILLVIAVLVICWIIWDHKNKNIKQNRYTKNKSQNKSKNNIKLPNSSFIKEQKSRDDLYSNSNKYLDNLDYTTGHYTDIDNNNNINSNFNSESNSCHGSSLNPKITDSSYDHDKKNIIKPNNKYILAKKISSHNFKEHIITMYLKSKDGQLISGDKLLQALVSAGLRFGDMNIFHRHEHASGEGKTLFSVASMVKPGYFNIDNMQEFETPGISMFCCTTPDIDYVLVYELMLKTAFNLAKFLDADILDEHRELLTTDKMIAIKESLEKVYYLPV